jgi:hypothetical protein
MANSSMRERRRPKAREMEGYNAEFGESVRDDGEEAGEAEEEAQIAVEGEEVQHM